MQHQSDFYSYLLDNNGQPTQQDQYYNGHNTGNFNNVPEGGDVATIDTQQLPSAESSTSATTTTPLKGGTDFRRRKNWSERILVEITGLLHVLSPTGKILYCSESTHELTGYRPHELVGQALMDFLHVDDMDVFIRDFQMSFHTRSQIKTHYRFRKKDDTYVIFEVVGHPKSDIPGQPPQSFFGIAQPVPTKNGAIIDAFLELKAENHWLKKRIDELSAKYGKILVPSFSSTENNSPTSTSAIIPNGTNYVNTIHQTRQHNCNSDSSSSQDILLHHHHHHHHHHNHHPLDTNNHNHINKKTTPSNNEDWIDTNNNNNDNELDDYMFNTKSETKYSDLATTSILHTEQDLSDRKDKWKRRKKHKGADEYVCADCGTTSSPEWRKGPHGPKTLCNACGLRWAKRNKKTNSNDD